ncbi:DUF3261 domain-containing protein [Crenothrix sp.]|uniref:DUF3261 domain-containing protein n=1 Tax=Crenothrix sp. TaxID=3100433 RepID=UPI00374D9BDF
MPRGLTFLALLVSLSSCAILPTSHHSEQEEFMPIAQPIGPARRVVQQLTAIWPGKQQTLLCVLELDRQRIAIAGLSSDGISLFSLSYDGKKLVLDKSPLLPESFSPELIIKDLQLVYWPASELQKLLPQQWRLEADNHHRRLYFNNVLCVEVNYLQPDASWPKTVELINHRYHYQLHINTISYESVPE